MTSAFIDNYRFLSRYNVWFNERLYGVCDALSDAQRLHDPACPFELVVVAVPAIDVDAADGGVHAFAFHQRHYSVDLRLAQGGELAVVDGNVGFAAG